MHQEQRPKIRTPSGRRGKAHQNCDIGHGHEEKDGAPVGQVEDPSQPRPEGQGDDGAHRVEQADQSFRGTKLGEVAGDMDQQKKTTAPGGMPQ